MGAGSANRLGTGAPFSGGRRAARRQPETGDVLVSSLLGGGRRRPWGGQGGRGGSGVAAVTDCNRRTSREPTCSRLHERPGRTRSNNSIDADDRVVQRE